MWTKIPFHRSKRRSIQSLYMHQNLNKSASREAVPNLCESQVWMDRNRHFGLKLYEHMECHALLQRHILSNAFQMIPGRQAAILAIIWLFSEATPYGSSRILETCISRHTPYNRTASRKLYVSSTGNSSSSQCKTYNFLILHIHIYISVYSTRERALC